MMSSLRNLEITGDQFFDVTLREALRIFSDRSVLLEKNSREAFLLSTSLKNNNLKGTKPNTKIQVMSLT